MKQKFDFGGSAIEVTLKNSIRSRTESSQSGVIRKLPPRNAPSLTPLGVVPGSVRKDVIISCFLRMIVDLLGLIEWLID